MALAACSSGTLAPAPTPEPAATSVSPTTTAAATTTAVAEAARCTAAELGVRLGDRGPDTDPGQKTVPLVYTNISSQPCVISGVPGVDLLGPKDPNGTTYSVPRPNADAAQKRYTLGPGQKATATLTYLIYTPGSTGSLGSTTWTPTQVVTTPPGDTHQLVTPWTSADTVLRQDSATHPGTFVGPLVAGPSS